jgi:hypothetical protein
MANEQIPGYNSETNEQSANSRLGRIITKRRRFTGKWMHPEWTRDWGKRGREKIDQDIRESRAGVQTFLTMAGLAIRMAVDTEPNKKIRNVKRRDLRQRWRRYQQELLGITRA